MSTDRNAQPLNPLPPVVWLLLLPMLAAELLFQAGGRGLVGGPDAVGWRLGALQTYGFYPSVFEAMRETGQYPARHLMRFVTYPFLHGNFTHLLFVAVFLLALGKMVGEVFRGWAVAAVFFGATFFGALVYGLVLRDPPPLIGGFPAVYGLIGAFTFLLWTNLSAVGANRYRAFTLIGILAMIQLVFGALFGAGPDWIADLSGFAAGFLLSFVVAPGAWPAIVEKLRRR